MTNLTFVAIDSICFIESEFFVGNGLLLSPIGVLRFKRFIYELNTLFQANKPLFEILIIIVSD